MSANWVGTGQLNLSVFLKFDGILREKKLRFTLRTLKTRSLHFSSTFVIRMLFFQPSLNILNFSTGLMLKIFREYSQIVPYEIFFRMYLMSGWCQESNFRARLQALARLI